MDILCASLRYWVAYKLNTDPAWAKVGRVFSKFVNIIADLVLA